MPINKLTFKVVDQQCCEFAKIESVFSKLIEPIYGSQDMALAKIGRGEDRICEALFEYEQPKGIIVYKKALVDGNLELKTLCLIDPINDSRKGFGSILIDRVIDTARRRDANKIVVTVSLQANALGFFKRTGFVVIASEKDKYKSGIEEYTLELKVHPENQFSYQGARKFSATILPKYSALQQYDYDEFNKPIYCSLRIPYVHAIASGAKIYEARVNTDFYSNYQSGKIVVWRSGQSGIRTKIISRKWFPSFESMLNEINFKYLVPEAKSKEEANKIYNEIPRYAEKSKKFGVLALGIKPCGKLETYALDKDLNKREPSDKGYYLQEVELFSNKYKKIDNISRCKLVF